MKIKLVLQILLDVSMTITLMLLMAFELIGRTAHEWIGISMFGMFILHHILNWSWTRNLFHSRFTPFRILQILCVFVIFITMTGTVISSVLISRQVFSFLSISTGRSFGRMLHMLCVYWNLVFFSFHLGIHWNVMMGVARKLCKRKNVGSVLLLRMIAVSIAVYGIFAFVRHGIPNYLFLRTQFVFFDYEQPLVLFFADYLAMMELFVFIGHYCASGVHKIGKRWEMKTE